jgi:hypothetical protein
MRLQTISAARLAAGPSWAALQGLPEWRRLAEPRAARGLQLALQAIDPLLQPILLPFELIVALAQRLAFALRPFGALPPAPIVGCIRLGQRLPFRHAAVMPEFSRRYKRNPLNRYGG